jgi:hypothetical protein
MSSMFSFKMALGTWFHHNNITILLATGESFGLKEEPIKALNVSRHVLLQKAFINKKVLII